VQELRQSGKNGCEEAADRTMSDLRVESDRPVGWKHPLQPIEVGLLLNRPILGMGLCQVRVQR